MTSKKEIHIFLLRNSFRRKIIAFRILILSLLFFTTLLMSIYDLRPFSSGHLFHCSLGLYLISLIFLTLIYRAHAGRFSLLKIENQALHLPQWFNPEKYKIIPLRHIYSIRLRGNSKDGFIMIGVKKGLNRTLVTSRFEVEENVPEFLSLIREAITFYEGGAENLAAREKISNSYESIIPVCSISICALLIISYILQQVLIENSDSVFELLRSGGLNRYLFASGEYFRLTSSVFLHLNLFHLLVNLFTLMVFGNLIEHIILRINLIGLFLLSGVISSLLSLIQGRYAVTLGASGAIYGVIGAYIYIRIKYSNILPSFIHLQQGWVLFLIFSVNMLYSLLNSNVNFICHLGGLVTGFIYTAVLSGYKNHNVRKLGDRSRISGGLLIILMFLYIYNFISLADFIQLHQDPEDYRKHFIQSVLSEGNAEPSDQVINLVSYYIANQKNASVNELYKARSKMEPIVKKRPKNHQCMDTLALIYFRSGLIGEAVEMEKQALALKDIQEYKLRLKEFEKYKYNNRHGEI